MLFLNLKKLRYELFYNIKKNNSEVIEESLNNYFVEAKKYGIFLKVFKTKKSLRNFKFLCIKIRNRK